MPMGPPGRQFPQNGWQPQQQQHQIPPQHPHYPPNHPSHQQQQARLRLQQQQQQQSSMPGSSNPNPVSAIQYARSGLQQRPPMLPMPSTSAGHSLQRAAATKKVKNSTIDKEKIQTWHDYPTDKRQLRKHRFGAPDVFPQDPYQEEDKMSAERIKRGFHLAPNLIKDEGESAMKHFIREEKEKNGVDKLDDFLHRAAIYIQTVSQKKSDTLDKKKIREISFGPFKDRQKLNQWLDELSRGKSNHLIAKKIPLLNTETWIEEMFEHKIPIPQAVWLLKLSHVGMQVILQEKEKQQNSKSKKQMEFCDFTLPFIKLIKDLMDKMEDEATAIIAKQKWKYYSILIRHSVMEGLVNRQEFFIELADVLLDAHQKCSLEKMHLYRIIITFVSLFTREITKNVFIARKFLYNIGLRLKGYMDETEKKKRCRQPPKQVFSELISCNNHRLIVLTSFGIIASIVIDCPEACIWMPLDESLVPMFLVGSPLDILPVDPLMFPTFLNEKESMEFSKTLKKLLASKMKQIHDRSLRIDNRWALNCARETDFHLIIRASVEVVSLLDTVDVTRPRFIFDLYSKVFGFTKGNDVFDGEIVIRVKAMLQWAITNEREGSFRALLVSKILQIYSRHFRSLIFDSRNFVQIVVDFLNRESPSPGKPSFHKEYANLILLLMELQRANLFSHDDYIMLLIRYNELKDYDPIIPKLQKLIVPEFKEPEAVAENQQQLIRNFLTPSTNTSSTSMHHQGGSLADHEFCRLKDDPVEEIKFMEKPEEISIHERLIIQLPIEQVESNRGAVNQRAIYLYGITGEREEAAKSLKLFATNIINKWMDSCYGFSKKRKNVRIRKNLTPLDESFKEFKKLTYYDRLCVTGYCMDGYLQIIRDFASRSASSLTLPTIEILDMLLSMAEASQCIGWTMTFFLECFPVILSCEKILDSVRTDFHPQHFSTQQCFAIVGFLAEHYKYFLLSKDAIKICNALFRVIEQSLRSEDYPTTAWGKAIAAFLIQARYDLRFRGKGVFAFRARDCQRLLPVNEEPPEFIDDFKENLFISEEELTGQRVYPYHNFKVFIKRLNSPGKEHSFVVNAFVKAKQFENDFSKLTDLANFCGNVSAVKSLEAHWLNVIEALCTCHGIKRMFQGFDFIDNSMDYDSHYTFSTFITLLATRFCFSIHDLFVRFNNNCFKDIDLYDKGKQSHLLLTLQIIANISTASDEPFYISKSLFNLSNIPFRVPWRTSDLRCLRILQIRELDATILPILQNVFGYVEGNKKKDTLREICSFAWNTILTISDQEWVISRMFQVCSLEKDMEEFVKDTEGKGKLLLFIALRRKTDRKYKLEVMESRQTTTKDTVQKRFTILTIWNLRATFCDIKVMVREVIPSKSGNGNRSAQYQVFATSLIGEIAKSCRDFFIQSDLEKIREVKAPTIETFTFADLNCYWLLAELIEIISIPEYVQKTVKGAILDEIVHFFTPITQDASEAAREKKLKTCANLLETQPFLNLISTCQQGEEKSRDNMIKMMLDCSAEMKFAENPTKLFEPRFNVDRAGILLRMNLVGSVIDFVNTPSDKLAEYAGCILQTIMNGVISPERDGEYFTTCYDLLLTLVLSLFTGSGQPQIDKDGNVKKPRYSDYAKFINKNGDKALPPNLRCLETLFPISAPTSEQPTFNDTFPVNSPMKNNGTKNPAIGPPGFAQKLKHIKLDKHCDIPQKRLQRFLYHTHQNDFFHPGTIGNPLPKGMLEQFVVGPPAYNEPGPEVKPYPQHHPQMHHQNSLMNMNRHPSNFQPNPSGSQFYSSHERPQMMQHQQHPPGHPMHRPPQGHAMHNPMGMQPPQNFNHPSMPQQQQQPHPGPPSSMLPPPQAMMGSNPNMFNNQMPPHPSQQQQQQQMHPPAGFPMQPQQQPQPGMNPMPRMQPALPEQLRPPIINTPSTRAQPRKRNANASGGTGGQPGPKKQRAENPNSMQMNAPPRPQVPPSQMQPPSYMMSQQQGGPGGLGPPRPQNPMWDPQQQPPNQGPSGMMQQPQQQQQHHPSQQQQHPSHPPMGFSNANNRFGPSGGGQGGPPTAQPPLPQQPSSQALHMNQRTEDLDTKGMLRETLKNKMEQKQAMQIPPLPPQQQPQPQQPSHMSVQQQQQMLRQQQMQQLRQQQQQQIPNPQQNFNPQMR